MPMPLWRGEPEEGGPYPRRTPTGEGKAAREEGPEGGGAGTVEQEEGGNVPSCGKELLEMARGRGRACGQEYRRATLASPPLGERCQDREDASRV
jgi:hypothetical protein